MDQKLKEIRDQQHEVWNKFSSGWKKWDTLTMDFIHPMGDEIIKQLHLKESDHVLDVAAGTGEPGLTIAGFVKDGKVTITDLSEKMLEVAKEKTEKLGLTNTEIIECDVCELPFADNSFDALSCRFGFMFFEDTLLAAKEMYRVLKPGGRISTSVWGIPDKNFWVTASMGVIKKHLEIPTPPPGSPGMFRCAGESYIPDLFEQAGFKNISQKEVTSKLNCGTAEKYWDLMNDIAAPVVSALSRTDESTKKQIINEILLAVNDKYPDGKVYMDSSAYVISAEK